MIKFLPFLFAVGLYAQVDYPTQLQRLPMLDPRGYQFIRTSGLGASGDLSASGAKSVTLTPCPIGVNFNDTGHYVRIYDGVGTAEAVLITGGSCTSGAASGSLNFTTVNTHTGSWKLASASSGLQEAIIQAGYYGGVDFGCNTLEIYAPVRRSYRNTIRGGGIDCAYLHNNSTTTGVINYTALNVPGDQDTFGGGAIEGFTIYSGAINNLATNTTVADAIYILGAGWNLEINVFIRNHTTGIHQVNGWYSKITGGGCRFFRDYCIYTEQDGNLGTGTQAGLGAGGGQLISDVKISNVAATGPQTSTGCAIRYANWSGFDLKGVDVTATAWGLCLQPRAAYGAETFTQVYYGTVVNANFDTTTYGGVLFDSTASTAGSVSAVELVGVKSAFNGCVSNCIAAPFTNNAMGFEFRGATGKPVKDIKITGSTARENGGHGFGSNATTGVSYITITGATADNNSQAANNTYDGFHFENSNFQISISNSMSGHLNSTLTREQRYGLYIGSAVTQAVITNNTFYPLNATAPCSVNVTSLLNFLSGNLPLDDTACNRTFSFLPGVGLPSYAFASLPTPSNGSVVYCNDCNATCTAGGGTGRTCFRENGAWTH